MMEVLITCLVFLCCVIAYLALKHYHEKKRDIKFLEAVNAFTEDCKANRKTTKQISEAFLETSKNNVNHLKELHMKTLEILTGEKCDQ